MDAATINAKKARIAEIEEAMRKLRTEHSILRQDVANAEAEFKPGDRINMKRGQGIITAKIESVSPGGGYYARRIRKDGTEGALFKVYHFEKTTKANHE